MDSFFYCFVINKEVRIYCWWVLEASAAIVENEYKQ